MAPRRRKGGKKLEQKDFKKIWSLLSELLYVDGGSRGLKVREQKITGSNPTTCRNVGVRN